MAREAEACAKVKQETDENPSFPHLVATTLTPSDQASPRGMRWPVRRVQGEAATRPPAGGLTGPVVRYDTPRPFGRLTELNLGRDIQLLSPVYHSVLPTRLQRPTLLYRYEGLL